MKKLIFTSLLCALVLTSCGSGSTDSSSKSESKTDTASVISTASLESAVTSTSENLNAEEITDKLQSSIPTIDNVIVYTTETDVNELMGRPNQYTSKTNFADSRLEQTDSENPAGGSVEVFKNAEDAAARKEYIDSIGKESPMFIEYSYLNGNVLLRLNKSLTPEQAEEYETALANI